ncbi:MAG: hypothetical protein ONB44_02460 [candidate division KSB1 bacterium]|nr:hypothetical protein [candidate division KSB1 bacterium]MDZ7300987.1 hypothetical protein [candidate division KSB1 bacterium]MDZ7310335.1 hypothetical protein [candidate division KSB1 bacterium]
MNRPTKIFLAMFVAMRVATTFAQLQPVVPQEKRGRVDAERRGFHDANNIRTEFWNYGMVGNYPPDPGNVDLSVFHSVEAPKGSGMNYSDGVTPFVLAKIKQRNGEEAYIMETGYRERQAESPFKNRVMRFEPRPGYFQADPNLNKGRSPAISNDPRTWPEFWPDKENDPDDPGWRGSWNGYFGKRPNADQESFTVMDDDFYDAWDFYPDSRDPTRRGLGLRVEVRGFQWANPQSQNVIFWHYDITNEGTTDYNENIIFGLYFDSGVGGSALSCDGIYESDDDNAFYDKSFGLNLTYTWDKYGHGRDLSGNCGVTGYLGYAYLETPGKPGDGIDNDDDGITDEKRDGGPGILLTSQPEIENYINANYNVSKFNFVYTNFKSRPAYRASRWWTGDEDLDWVAELHDTGADGVFGTKDTGEGDGIPTYGEPNFDRTDLNESDQIGLTGFKMNRIRSLTGEPTDNIVFFSSTKNWPRLLYEQFTAFDPAARFDQAVVLNYNIGFLFASGPFTLPAGKTERFSLALAYGADLTELRETVSVVQKIYNANYQFATPPEAPTVTAEAGDGYVRLSWDDLAERGSDPVTLENDFEGYRIYRATDPEFRDPRVITTGRGTGPLGNGRPIAQFDLINGKKGFSKQVVEGVAFYLGNETGLRHTFTDTTVINGQLYYYAVCAYDHGSDSLDFYPSENAIAVSRTPRGGTILPKNVVAVRPNPKVLGFVPASVSAATHTAGTGIGTVEVNMVNSELVPNNHVFNVRFRTTSPDSVRAYFYDLIDSTAGKVVFTNGYDLEGVGSGPVGLGLLPVVTTPSTMTIDSLRTGFTSTSQTNTRLKFTFQNAINFSLANRDKFKSARLINLRRPGFPDNITITFADVAVDTSVNFGIGRPARPAKFRIVAHTPSGDLRLKFGMFDSDRDGTLSRAGEYIAILTEIPDVTTSEQETWRVELDTTGQSKRGPIVPPKQGDVYHLVLNLPLTPVDVFSFRTTGQSINAAKAKDEFKQEPYVVPNPYVGAASFEAERFAVSGRGERRMEFRSLPANCTIRIYTVRGELVQTLRHDGSNTGMVAWDLRTKDNLDVAPGLYLFHVDGGETGNFIGKFAIIK